MKSLAPFLRLVVLPVLTLLPACPVHATEPAVALKLVAGGFTQPVVLAPLPDGSARLLVVDQTGVIHVVDSSGSVQEKPFLDLRGKLTRINEGFDERGVVGLALHPDFKANGRVFVTYSAPLQKNPAEDWDHTSRVSQFKADAEDFSTADPASERVILEIHKPYFNHNSGNLAFGPDGFLYVSVGDGGNANDVGRGHAPQGNGQDTTTLLGKVLRLDVDKGKPYAIPADNPFADGKRGRPEIFAYGLRNPWGMSFDRGGRHELFLGDVGQTMFEEVNIIVRGGNYGWNVREGFHCFDPKNPKKPPADCPTTGASGEPLIDPILEYKNIKGHPKDPEGLGICVVGGYVYRGKALPHLAGRYVFADWTQNWIKGEGIVLVATPPAPGAESKWSVEQLKLAGVPDGKPGAYIVALGQDAEGELYILTNDTNRLVGKSGKVHKLVPQ